MGYMLTAVVRGTTLVETDTFEVETYKDLPDFVNSPYASMGRKME